MNILLNTCYIIWAIYFFGKDTFPLVFRNLYVFWGVNIGLVILVSFGFVKSLSIYFRTEKKTIKSISHSAWFLLLFLLMIILPITVHHAMDSLSTFAITMDRALPIKDTSTPGTEESRKCLASFLFTQYGIEIPYKLDTGDYKIFQPTEKEIKEYEDKLKRQKESIEIEKKLKSVAWSSFKLATIQAVLFFVVFLSTLIYEQKQVIQKNS